ncbi:hypothetical protein [Streptomyces sp.]|uniref:hypothetical protein n=1 Tax=Streptomyces sp. TaxID=1931 RepID=UPI002F42759E
MSSEHDDDGHADERVSGTAKEHDRDRSARRPRLTVVAVATAVLLAGGGGAYWAATADGGRGDTQASQGTPEPLRLDGHDEMARSDGATGPNGGARYELTGTLPEGPASAAVYRTTGEIGKDAVRHLADLLGVSGPVTSEYDAWRVGGSTDGGGPALLVSKEAPGTWSYSHYGPPAGGARPDGREKSVAPPEKAVPPEKAGGGTSDPASPPDLGAGSAPADGSVTSTVVPDGAPGTAPDSATSSASGTASGSVTATGSGAPPVPEAKARVVAAPVLAGLGLSDARIDATGTVGALRTVSADPVVGGLPTHGWATSLQIGSDGVLTLGYGRLAPLVKGATYPVVGAEQALKELNATSPVEPSDHGIASCVAPMPRPMPMPMPEVKPAPSGPSDDRTLPHTMPCVPGNGHPTEVRGAAFGLALEFVSGRQTLVPAWLFDTAPAGVSRTTVVAGTAVDPSYIRRGGALENPAPGGITPLPPEATAVPGGPPQQTDPVEPADPGAPRHERVTAYRTSGTVLTVTFWGGVCDTYKAAADETDTQVRVSVTATPLNPNGDGVCPAIAKQLTASVRLAQPLGDRTVVDAPSGRPVRGQ